MNEINDNLAEGENGNNLIEPKYAILSDVEWICEKCGKRSFHSQEERKWTVRLNLEGVTDGTPIEYLIASSLDRATMDSRKAYCPDCDMSNMHRRMRTDNHILPEFLTVALPRIPVAGEKNRAQVKLPLDKCIEIAVAQVHIPLVKPKKVAVEASDPKYRIMGVAKHEGIDIKRGHCTSWWREDCQSPNHNGKCGKVWACCDDESVTTYSGTTELLEPYVPGDYHLGAGDVSMVFLKRVQPPK